MSSKYAIQTEVSPEKSRAEIERTLLRYGATRFMYGWDEKHAMVSFVMRGKQIRFVVEMPDKNDPKFARTPSRRQLRSTQQKLQAWEQATKQKWRTLALVIKAKLEFVESSIASFETEFLAHIVMPDGKTVAEHVLTKVEDAYLNHSVPLLLPGIGETNQQ